jgi:hypothetical protein
MSQIYQLKMIYWRALRLMWSMIINDLALKMLEKIISWENEYFVKLLSHRYHLAW